MCRGFLTIGEVNFQGSDDDLAEVPYGEEVPGLLAVPIDGDQFPQLHRRPEEFGDDAALVIGAGFINIGKPEADGRQALDSQAQPRANPMARDKTGASGTG